VEKCETHSRREASQHRLVDRSVLFPCARMQLRRKPDAALDFVRPAFLIPDNPQSDGGRPL
jgi:hypothetical protein